MIFNRDLTKHCIGLININKLISDKTVEDLCEYALNLVNSQDDHCGDCNIGKKKALECPTYQINKTNEERANEFF